MSNIAPLPQSIPEFELAQPSIGVIESFDQDGRVRVICHGRSTPADSTVPLNDAALGRRCVLLFADGDPLSPIIVGLIQQPSCTVSQPVFIATIDQEHLLLQAEQEVALKCGKASITLTRDGRILIKGAYVSSRSSGTQRILGATIEMN